MNNLKYIRKIYLVDNKTKRMYIINILFNILNVVGSSMVEITPP